MRFVPIIVIFMTGLSIGLFPFQSSAKPGDSVDFSKPLTSPKSRVIFGRANDKQRPTFPKGMKLSLAAQVTGGITALASSGSDLFVTSNKDGKLYRFRDRDNNGIYEVKSLFLTGFDNPQSLAIIESQLFIADKTGIWRIAFDSNLVARKSPELITPLTGKNTNLTNPLLISDTASKRLLVAVYDQRERKTILGRYEGNSLMQVSTLNGNASAIAVSPSGDVFAAISSGPFVQLGEIRGNTFINYLELNGPVTSIGFPAPNNKLKADWRDDIIISLGGAAPNIVRGHFKFGKLQNSGTEFVGNFSEKSRLQGASTVWDTPGPVTFNKKDELLFSGLRGGKIWLLQDARKIGNIEFPREFETNLKPENEQKSVTAPVPLPRGSSISYGSAIKDDPLLIPKVQNEAADSQSEDHKITNQKPPKY